MSWVVEQLHRDGSVINRVMIRNRAESVEQRRKIRIGRATDNDVIIDDGHCAAHHAEPEIDADGRAGLRDLGTRNGIVNGRGEGVRAMMFDVTSDQHFRLGAATIRVRSSAWAFGTGSCAVAPLNLAARSCRISACRRSHQVTHLAWRPPRKIAALFV